MNVLKPEFIKAVQALGAPLEGLVDGLRTEAEVSVRLNRAKGAEAAEAFDPVEWCADGYYLPQREAFTLDPALHQGLYYVQDASSMAISAVAAQIVKKHDGRPLRWLDACAAPGGKTTAIASQLPKGSMLVANEFDPKRAAVLAENVAKWGCTEAACVRGDAARFAAMRGAYDVVSADVPCSGEGMMRKDPEAAMQWSPALVAECARTQWRIAEALWQAVRPGGLFVYSTCTFNRTENEEIVGRLATECGATGVAIEALERPEIVRGIGTTLPCYRFLPGRIRGEGLFLCVLRKPGLAEAAQLRPAARKQRKPDFATQAVSEWLTGEYAVTTDTDGTVRALPAALAALVPEARGAVVAQIKGRDIMPAQCVAMNMALRPEAFPRVDTDYTMALAYLRREAIVLAEEAPRGIVLLHYNGRPLGFAKNLGRRANNLYPAPWRILTTHTPAMAPGIVV